MIKAASEVEKMEHCIVLSLSEFDLDHSIGFGMRVLDNTSTVQLQSKCIDFELLDRLFGGLYRRTIFLARNSIASLFS